MLPLVILFLVKSVTGQISIQNQMSGFALTTCRPDQTVCAVSTADRLFNVRFKSQCVLECQRDGSTTCVGVNYRQTSNVCEIYNRCPTNFTISNLTDCQHWQKRKQDSAPVCPASAAIANSSYPYVSSDKCSYPFTYNGTVYYSCMRNLTVICGSCFTSNRQYALCYPPAVIVQSVFDWIVFQQRAPTTGTEYNWQLSWSLYKSGFGTSSSNFWLGLERMNFLTSRASYKLRIEMQQMSTGRWFSAEYSSFKIGDESGSKYQLQVSGYSGDAGDSLQWTGDWNGDGKSGSYLHNGMKFTTNDQDNDNYPTNCAAGRGGGWWFNSCFNGCLTCDDAHTRWGGLGPTTENYTVSAARMMMKLNS